MSTAETESIRVRYLIDDVRAAIEFYTGHLGFAVALDASPAFAAVSRGPVQLLLSGPASSAARPMPDGTKPVPGGWNRLQLVVDDIHDTVARLRADGVPFRNDVLSGPGGQQVLVEDPSGNVVELFQPARDPA
jgi:catechol 2,3-dioxygenase-like lactoylglutathione lyase family enzyme